MSQLQLPRSREIVGLVSVEGGVVNAALIELHPGSPARVLVHVSSLITSGEVSSTQAVATITDRLGRVLGQLHDKAVAAHVRLPVHTVYCTISSRWTASEIINITKDFAKPTTLSHTVIAELAKEAIAKQPDAAKNMFEASIINFWVDGYMVRSPEGSVGTTLSLSVILSSASNAVKENCQSVLEKYFPVAKIEWRSTTRALVKVLSNQRTDDRNYSAIHIAVDATEILSIRDGMLVGKEVIDTGLRALLDAVGKTRSTDETLGLLKMLTQETCDDAACTQIQTAMAASELYLAKVFGEALSRVGTERKLANTLYVSAHQDIVPWMTQFFSRLDFTQFTVTTLPFTVQPIGLESLKRFVACDATTPLSLALAAALVNIESQD